MQSSVWVALLRHVPPEKHSQLMLMTASGVEVTIAALLRIDAECVAIKGRLSGTQDSGRVFFIPYTNIDYFGFQQPLKDTEFDDLFADLVLPASGAEAPAPLVANPEPLSVPAPAPPSAPPPSAVVPEPDGLPAFPRLPIKSAVLERFRARGSGLGPAE